MAATSQQRPDLSDEELAESLRRGVNEAGQGAGSGNLGAVRQRAHHLRYRRRAAGFGAICGLLIVAFAVPMALAGRSGSDGAVQLDTANDPPSTVATPTTTQPENTSETPEESAPPPTSPTRTAPPVTLIEETGPIPGQEGIGAPDLDRNNAPAPPSDDSLPHPSPPLVPGAYVLAEITYDGVTVSLRDLVLPLSNKDGGIGSIMLGRDGGMSYGIPCSASAGDGSYTTSTGYLDIVDLGSVLAIDPCPGGWPAGTNPATVSATYQLLSAGMLTTSLDGDFVALSSGGTSALAYWVGPPEDFLLDDDTAIEELSKRMDEIRQHIIQLLDARD